MYRVIEAFTDRVDGEIYRAGETYPRRGSASAERIKELSGNGNRLRRPLIEKVPEKKKKKVEK